MKPHILQNLAYFTYKQLIIRILFLYVFCIFFLIPKNDAIAQSTSVAYNPFFAEMETSTMQIPIRLAWAEVEQKINAQLQGVIYEAKDMVKSGNNRFHIKIWKLQPVRISGSNKGLESQAAIRINVKGVYKTQVMGLEVSQDIDQDLKLKLLLNTELNIQPNWDMKSSSQLVSYEWIEKPYLRFGFLKIPLSSIVEPMIEEQKTDILKEVDKQIEANLKFQKQIETAWQQFQTPFPTSEWGQEKTWLWFTPSKPVISPIEYLKDYLQVTLSMDAKSEATLALNPEKIKLQKLPSPRYSKEPITPQTNLWVYGRTDYATAKAKAKEVFSKEPYSFRKGRYIIYVKDLDFTQEGDLFKIQLDLTGTVEGRVYLQGKPYFNPRTKKFGIEAFKYDTEDAKVKVSKFMRWMFAKKIKNQIQQGFEEAIEDQVESIRKDIKENLKAYQFDEYSTLLGTVDEFYFDKIWIEQGIVKVRANLKGIFEVQLANF